jgi:hypothetical protein
MKYAKSFLIFVVFISITPIAAHSKEWRDLVPLRSNRLDVEKLLGQPPAPPSDGTRIYSLNETRSIYFIDEGEVYIVYARDENLERFRCLDLIPTDTVLFIKFTPKKEPPLEEMQIDESKFITFDPSEPPNIGFKAFVNQEEGIAICTQDGKVNQITYYGTAKERKVCPSLHSNPKDFCSILVDFIR